MAVKKLIFLVILSVGCLSTTLVFATADAPDYFKIKSHTLEGSVPSSPTFDCKKATHQVENDICADPDLIYLDHYMAKVYRGALKKASKSEYPNTERVKNLKTIQRGWIKGRNDCWKVPNNTKQCISNQYSHRITYLQAKWMLIKPIRTELFVCNPPYTDLEVSFFSTELLPSLVIQYGDQRNVFIATNPSTNLARYDGEFGSYFTLQGKNATFQWDQFKPPLICKRK